MSTPLPETESFSSPLRFFDGVSKLPEQQLPLPQKYNHILENFACVDSCLILLKRRKETCTYDKLAHAVQETTRRLGQFLCAVYCSEVGYQ